MYLVSTGTTCHCKSPSVKPLLRRSSCSGRYVSPLCDNTFVDGALLTSHDAALHPFLSTRFHGQSCTRPVHAVRFAHSSVNNVGLRTDPKPLPQIQHLLRSTPHNKRFARRIITRLLLPLPSIPQTLLQRVRPIFLKNTWRVNSTTLRTATLQQVWRKLQVRPCLCKMAIIITIIALQASSLTPTSL